MDLILLAASSPTITLHISTAAGSINSYPIVQGFLHLAIRRAARYDACCAFSGIVMMLLSRTFCLIFLSLEKNPYLYLQAPHELLRDVC